MQCSLSCVRYRGMCACKESNKDPFRLWFCVNEAWFWKEQDTILCEYLKSHVCTRIIAYLHATHISFSFCKYTRLHETPRSLSFKHMQTCTNTNRQHNKHLNTEAFSERYTTTNSMLNICSWIGHGEAAARPISSITESLTLENTGPLEAKAECCHVAGCSAWLVAWLVGWLRLVG